VSASHTTVHQSLIKDVEALVAALMGDAPVAELIEITDRIAAAVEYWDDIPASAIADLRSAIDLMHGGKACATVSALLTARSELTAPPQLS
jgi:N-methylhydantoinase B/oxoprolinase/acetone carboxylase alpha subunit